MPWFYFDITDADGFHSDRDGLEFVDRDTACSEARRTLPDLARGAMKDDTERLFTIVVKSESSTPFYTATLTMGGASLPAR